MTISTVRSLGLAGILLAVLPLAGCESETKGVHEEHGRAQSGEKSKRAITTNELRSLFDLDGLPLPDEGCIRIDISRVDSQLPSGDGNSLHQSRALEPAELSTLREALALATRKDGPLSPGRKELRPFWAYGVISAQIEGKIWYFCNTLAGDEESIYSQPNGDPWIVFEDEPNGLRDFRFHHLYKLVEAQPGK